MKRTLTAIVMGMHLFTANAQAPPSLASNITDDRIGMVLSFALTIAFASVVPRADNPTTAQVFLTGSTLLFCGYSISLSQHSRALKRSVPKPL